MTDFSFLSGENLLIYYFLMQIIKQLVEVLVPKLGKISRLELQLVICK